MIFEIKHGEQVYQVDDLKPYNEQTKAFQKAFNESEKTQLEGCSIAQFDNADISVFYNNRVIITSKEIEDENI